MGKSTQVFATELGNISTNPFWDLSSSSGDAHVLFFFSLSKTEHRFQNGLVFFKLSWLHKFGGFPKVVITLRVASYEVIKHEGKKNVAGRSHFQEEVHNTVRSVKLIFSEQSV